jgi:hypothetical protein
MNIENVFRSWAEMGDEIEVLKEKRKVLFTSIMESLMPYQKDSIILVKGKYHNSKEGRVLHYTVEETDFSWKVKIVVRCIGDDGEELGPTDWNNLLDYKLQEVVDKLNTIYPPLKFGTIGY